MAGLLVVMGAAVLGAQTAPVNEISAELGPCSVQLKVMGIDQKPVAMAKVATRVQYGLAGMKRLDLGAYTDYAGEVKIVGLPEFRKKPLLVRVSKDGAEGLVEYKPEDKCQATLSAVLAGR